ncbi:MAG: DUF2914 domain-containing protein [Patescibacteria group bacterium]|nr:DUF2914 domain-containing protein [Patescibacteria group bacterium]
MITTMLKKLFTKYEHYLSPGALIGGFVWDNFTLQRIDLWLENLVILTYLFITGASILFLNAHSGGKFRNKFSDKFVKLIPLFLQFAFGGLFSAFVIFYTKSADIWTSWPFLLVLAGLLLGNELFRERYKRFVFQLSIYFVALFSYSIFAVPVFVGQIGAWVFILSGFLSLALIVAFVFIISRFLPVEILQNKRLITYSIGGIYLLFNIFYFTNIMPPAPLALKEGGVYHYVERLETGDYFVRYESPPWYLFFKDYNPIVHLTPNQPVYVYGAIFAPTKLNTKIVHRWAYYNERRGEWIVTDKLGYQIFGGRDGGYRGYTYKSNTTPGKWRVDIITERGQVLGRMKFDVTSVESPPDLKVDLK